MEALKIDISKVFGFVPKRIFMVCLKRPFTALKHWKKRPGKGMILWVG